MGEASIITTVYVYFGQGTAQLDDIKISNNKADVGGEVYIQEIIKNATIYRHDRGKVWSRIDLKQCYELSGYEVSYKAGRDSLVDKPQRDDSADIHKDTADVTIYNESWKCYEILWLRDKRFPVHRGWWNQNRETHTI